MKFEKALKDKLDNLDLGFDPKAWEQVEQKISSESADFHSLKNGLNDFNAGYSEQAWTNISTRIASNNAAYSALRSLSRMRIAAGVAAAALIGFISYPFIISGDSSKTELTKIEKSIEKKSDSEINNNTSKPVKQLSPEVPIEETSNSQLVADELKSPTGSKEIASVQPSIQKAATPIHPQLLLAKNEYCVGEELTFKIQNPSDKNLVVELDGKRVRSNKKTLTNSGSRQLELIDISNKKSPIVIASKEIAVYSPGELQFNQNRVQTETSQATQFATSAQNLVDINWYSESSFIGNGSTVEHVFTSRGRYQIKMVATDNNGCKDSVVQTVRILKAYNLMATQIFNPEKETWLPVGLKQKDLDFELRVISGDGKEAFTSTDRNTEWDGRLAETGKKAKDGEEYYWVAKVKNQNGNVHEYGGSFIVSTKL